MRVGLLIQYDGTNYHGWQIQNGQETVQGVLENALRRLFSSAVGLMGSGRTDSGVHALGQVAHFDVESCPIPSSSIWMALNQQLPKDIRVIASREVAAGFHSRFDARQRSYAYQLSTRINVLKRNSQWHLRYPIDQNKLTDLARLLTGQHDFSSFCYAGTETENMNCQIMKAEWIASPDGEFEFQIRGNRFLHHMVRMLVGSMVEVARGKWTPEQFETLLLRPDRQAHVITAPACGLTLMEVKYPEALQPEWEQGKLNLVDPIQNA